MPSPSSAGNTRGLIEAVFGGSAGNSLRWSSAGNTRGLIEAEEPWLFARPRQRLPRGIPAASLKGHGGRRAKRTCRSSSSAGNTRGLIEAATGPLADGRCSSPSSSAGNTRGLIEACCAGSASANWLIWISLPRGIPAASLKQGCRESSDRRQSDARLPRGIPAASLKLVAKRAQTYQRGRAGLPRGIPAASLKLPRDSRPRERPLSVASSAGNTRGLIEASRGGSETSGALAGRSLPRGIPAASLKATLTH